MLAVRLTSPGRPLELHNVPIPAPGANDVLVRVKAAGICHSDAHYRAGRSRVYPLPLTLGHEVAGIVESVGSGVLDFARGDRVCIHYLATCGTCAWCLKDNEQFCASAQMIGKYRDGGYAEFVVVPARSVFLLPEEISYEYGAVMMCSSATSLHALHKSRLKTGELVAIFGVGGLGLSAIQLARAMRASIVYAVDIQPTKLELARRLGAVPVDASKDDPVQRIMQLTNGRGADVSLELIGLPMTMQQAVRCLAIKGRAALVGLMDSSFAVSPYHEVINKEAEIIGVSDHLASEIPKLLEFARAGKLDLKHAISRRIPLSADAINEALDGLEAFGEHARVVVVP